MLKTICLTLALAALAWPDTATTKKTAAAKHRHSVSAAHRAKAPAGKTAAGQSKKTPSSKVSAANAKGKKTRHAPRSSQQAPTAERYKEIQDSLASKGYFKGEANGQWGPESDDALKRFQADQNLTPDGKMSSLSIIALGLGPKRLTAQSSAKPANPPPAPDTPK